MSASLTSAASLTFSEAQRILAVGLAKAEEIGQPMNIAVVDAGGHLLAFGRQDGAIKVSIDISQRKARTAILMELPTAALMPLVQPGAELYGLEHTSGGLVGVRRRRPDHPQRVHHRRRRRERGQRRPGRDRGRGGVGRAGDGHGLRPTAE